MSRRRSARDPAAPASTAGAAPPVDRGRGASWRFVLGFAVGMTLFELYWSTLTPDAGFWRGGYFQVYLEWNARISGWLLSLAGYDTQVAGTSIFSGAAAVDVRRGCDGMQPSALFAIAVLVFPAPWRRRLVGAALGVVVLLAMNVARIVTLYLLRAHVPSLFDEAHHWLWPMAFIVVALAMWIAWVRGVVAPYQAAVAE